MLVYGTSRYYRALAKYNERIIPDPRRMRHGTRLDIPTQVCEPHLQYALILANQRACMSIPAVDLFTELALPIR